eukprot:PITA_08735
MGWKTHQMDVKTTFLNEFIKEEVYIEQLEGFDTFDRESHVCRLKRVLYGLKQAPHAWYTRMDNHLTRGSCKIIRDEGHGTHAYFLVLEVWQGGGELFVTQDQYANEILMKFRMESSKPMDTPLIENWRKEDGTSGEEVEATIYRQLVGSLMYLVNIRPNICYASNHISQAMVNPTKLYWKATKHVLRYLRDTNQFGPWYKQREGVKLQGFVDVDWVGSPSDRKSI